MSTCRVAVNVGKMSSDEDEYGHEEQRFRCTHVITVMLSDARRRCLATHELVD